jgi:hypothetical protein
MNIMLILCRRRSAAISHNIAQERQTKDVQGCCTSMVEPSLQRSSALLAMPRNSAPEAAALAAFLRGGRDIGPAAGALDRLLDHDPAGTHRRGSGGRARRGRRRVWGWRGPCRFLGVADEPVVHSLPAGEGFPHRIDGDAEQDDLEQESHCPVVLTGWHRVKPSRVQRLRPL